MSGDRQALSTARYSRAGQLATADTCFHQIACRKVYEIILNDTLSAQSVISRPGSNVD